MSLEWCTYQWSLQVLADSPSMTTIGIQLIHSFHPAHPLIIQLQFSSLTIYFDMYSSSIAEYENKDIPKICLISEEFPWDPSIEEYSECQTCTLDHGDQIIIPAKVANWPVFVSIVFVISLAFMAVLSTQF